MVKEVSIVLVDDHSLVRDGIRALLEEEKFLKVIGEASNGEEAIDIITSLNPDVAIIDVRMPLVNGIEAVRKLIQKQVKTRSIILSMHDSEEYVLESIEAGAFGYILKDAPKEELLRAIYNVSEGEKYFSGDISKIVVNKYLENLKSGPEDTPKNQITNTSTQDIALTKREREILKLILEGKSNKEIAEELGKSVRTIETHRYNLMKNKLHVKNVAELVKKVKELNLD